MICRIHTPETTRLNHTINTVIFANQSHFRLELGCFFRSRIREGHDNNFIAYIYQPGSGTVDALNQALSQVLGVAGPVDRESEGKLYERLLREQYQEPDLILENAGMWTANRIAV